MSDKDDVTGSFEGTAPGLKKWSVKWTTKGGRVSFEFDQEHEFGSWKMFKKALTSLTSFLEKLGEKET